MVDKWYKLVIEKEHEIRLYTDIEAKELVNRSQAPFFQFNGRKIYTSINDCKCSWKGCVR